MTQANTTRDVIIAGNSFTGKRRANTRVSQRVLKRKAKRKQLKQEEKFAIQQRDNFVNMMKIKRGQNV